MKQMESILASMQKIYRSQCEPAAHMFSEGLLNIVEANGVRVGFGGNDGFLVTIDGAGQTHVYGPEGPAVRNAITSVLQGMNTLTAQAA